MDAYTAFLIGVLVGQWILLFVIWRAVTKLVRMLNSYESEHKIENNNTRTIGLHSEGQHRDIDKFDW